VSGPTRKELAQRLTEVQAALSVLQPTSGSPEYLAQASRNLDTVRRAAAALLGSPALPAGEGEREHSAGWLEEQASLAEDVPEYAQECRRAAALLLAPTSREESAAAAALSALVPAIENFLARQPEDVRRDFPEKATSLLRYAVRQLVPDPESGRVLLRRWREVGR